MEIVAIFAITNNKNKSNMKRILAFIGNHICRIIISAALLVVAFHWGMVGVIPMFIVWAMWDRILFEGDE